MKPEMMGWQCIIWNISSHISFKAKTSFCSLSNKVILNYKFIAHVTNYTVSTQVAPVFFVSIINSAKATARL